MTRQKDNLIGTVTSHELRKRFLLILLTCSMFLLSACGSREAVNTSESDAGQATDLPVATSEEPPKVPETIVPLPTANPTDPLYLTISPNPSGEPIPADLIVELYDYVIIGRVIEQLPARWTTPDAQRPDNPFEVVPDTFTIVTPYVIQLEVPLALQQLTGPVIPLDDEEEESISLQSSHVVVLTSGGEVGKDTVLDLGYAQSLTVGEQVMLAISESQKYDPEKDDNLLVPTDQGAGWWTNVKYILTSDGFAVGSAGPQPASELITAILEAIALDPLSSTPTP